jgi:hypothetical protein
MAHVNSNRAWRADQAIRQALFALEEIDLRYSDGEGAAGGIEGVAEIAGRRRRTPNRAARQRPEGGAES